MSNKYQTIFNYIDQLNEEVGHVTPEALVDKARPKKSPIHDFFEWDDAKGAEAHRRWQARRYIKIYVEPVSIRGVDVEISVYRSVFENDKRQYMKTGVVLKDKDLRNQTIADAIRRLRHWQALFEKLQELSKVIDEKELKKAEDSIN